MKIIHILLGKGNPDRMNGVNKVAHSLATQQTLLGAEVELWGITPKPSTKSTARIYKTRFFKDRQIKWLLDEELLKALQEQEKSTVFHLHAGFIPQFYGLSTQLTSLDLKYVITPHGNYMNGAMKKNKTFKRLYFNFFEKKILQNALFIHCIGKGEIDDIALLGQFNKIKLIPNGQDLSDFNFDFHQIQSEEAPIFGFCGRVTKHQKGLDLLIEAFRIYKQELQGTGELWLVGEGEYKTELQSIISSFQLNKVVRLWGSKFGNEKLNIMANMDAFFHPSRNEGLPMAVLEAAVLKKPLVVSQFTNMAEYVSAHNAGICLLNNTPAEIAESMQKIALWKQNHKLTELGENAYQMFLNHFEWKHIAQELIDAYAS